MEIDIQKLAEQGMKVFRERYAKLAKLNILLIGKSGVGKSTLINSLFRGKFAETGLGRPVTKEIRKIEKKDFPLTIYDTPGFELASGQQKKVKDEITEIISKGAASKDFSEAIHCIWYCINVGGNRTFDESEYRWLKELTESNKTSQVPIMVILTQAVPKPKAEEMKRLVEKENLDIVKVIPVLAQDMYFDEDYTAKAYGLDTLVTIMSEVLPDELQDTFENLQQVLLESKVKKSRAIVYSAVAGAFGEGFTPLPFADAALLIPTQISMIAGISVVFGLDLDKGILTNFITSILGSGGATIIGRTIVSNLFKLIPGAGTIAGGLISGSTAALLTTALGEAYIKFMSMIFKGEIDHEALYSKKGLKILREYFKDFLKNPPRK